MEAISDYDLFEPLVYLQEYYADIGAENRALFRFLTGALRDVPAGATMLDFGGGPTLYAAIAAAPHVSAMHLTDYSEANLSEVRRWLAADPHAFDWRDITRAILRLEGLPAGPADVAAREALTRQRVTRVSRCDAKALCPLEEAAAAYDLLVTNFCLEAAAGDLDEWRRCMCAVLAYLRPGGRLVLSAVRGAASYPVGHRSFLAVRLFDRDLAALLGDLGFLRDTMAISSEPADRPGRPYEGIMLATAVKGPGEARS